MKESRSLSLDEYDGDEDLLLRRPSLKKVKEFNPLKFLVISGFIVFVFVSGFATHKLISGLSSRVRKQRLDNIAEVVDPTIMKENHIELSNSTHLVGSERNYQLAQMIARKFKEYDFDSIEIKNYSIRFPFPDPHNPNSVKLLDSSTGNVIHECRKIEEPLTDFEKSTPTTSLFNALSKPGTVKAPYVYANLANAEDFALLKKNNIDVQNKIVLVRYGNIFRGNQAQNAIKAGASGIVFFKDLAEPEVEKRYPESEWAPASAGARGTLGIQNGDNESLGWPSVPGGYKKPGNLSVDIIGQPITGDDARSLLKALPSNPNFTMPSSWGVGLIRDEFSVGTGGADSPLLEVIVNRKVKLVNVTNVIGTIRGVDEPDRWVLHGVHRDSWTYGGTDPNSGTAAMLEVGRVLSYYLKRGWRPRRTIKLCSWDGEEWGLYGSLEWIEEHRKLLRHNAVAYINTDVAESGTCQLIMASGSPMFQMLADKVISKINKETFSYKGPEYYSLSGSGSDMFGFYSYAGVSVLDIECMGSNDLYHTLYDNQHLFNLIDKDYKHLAAVATALAKLVVGISEPALLPINITDYTTSIQGWWRELKPQLINVVARLEITEVLYIIDDLLVELHDTATAFHRDIYSKASETNSDLYLRQINDKLMLFERAFLEEQEIPGTDFYSRNIIASPSQDNVYAGSGFPALQYIVGKGSEAKKSVVLFEIERLRWALKSAIENLKC